jgi:UDP-N-acetylglucosamine:LPS N-acetylglucosamine transferase
MRRAAEPPVDVLLVCTAGGHLMQMWSLRNAWAGYSTAWVVASHEGPDVDSLLADERLYRAYSPANRSLKNLVRNLVLARRLLRRTAPKAMITTGAAVAVPFAWMAKLRGIPVTYVESLARVERPSLSCRLVAPVADRVYVQWPELLSALPGARYAGAVFPQR